MKFVRHEDSIMGCYEIEGVLWAFNLAENPELAAQYLAWLAEGNTPEEWNPDGTL